MTQLDTTFSGPGKMEISVQQVLPASRAVARQDTIIHSTPMNVRPLLAITHMPPRAVIPVTDYRVDRQKTHCHNTHGKVHLLPKKVCFTTRIIQLVMR